MCLILLLLSKPYYHGIRNVAEYHVFNTKTHFEQVLSTDTVLNAQFRISKDHFDIRISTVFYFIMAKTFFGIWNGTEYQNLNIKTHF